MNNTNMYSPVAERTVENGVIVVRILIVVFSIIACVLAVYCARDFIFRIITSITNFETLDNEIYTLIDNKLVTVVGKELAGIIGDAIQAFGDCIQNYIIERQ